MCISAGAAMACAGIAGAASGRNLADPAAAWPAGTPQSQERRDPVETSRLMLSGHGPDDAVIWDFRIDGGRRAGEKARIPVPSNWQQHGFGVYEYGNEDAIRRKDHGFYSRHFKVPGDWKDKRVRLVFDGAMTDTLVRVNGVQAGPVHQGGFYRFAFDVTKLVRMGGDNLVEVEVSEASSNSDTNQAERFSDYWVFGGIFRPVWLEASPVQAIEHAAIDGRADGSLSVDVTLAAAREVDWIEAELRDEAGRRIGEPFEVRIPAGGAGRVRLATRINAPRLWTAESPNLYRLTLTLYQGARAVHRSHERFGFRTFEVRPGSGLYLNGQRILLKGVNRHSFRPDTARALTREDNYDDVRTIKSMNMNAVRMSHYPPDESFLEAADELGLYVLDELSGWQHAHDTEVGRRLVREMVERDVNHPSVILWDNGNEGGFNRELDGDFALYDPQKRRVLHPWELHDGIDTKHYSPYADLLRRLAGPDLVMPTEFMHGLFDGGAGAGLDDYWQAIAKSPRGAGGFIWSFADEGVARTDQDGQIDVFGSYAPDGILGPRHEREPSYYTVRDIWSPVQIAAPRLDAGFTGVLRVANGFDFTSLDRVRFEWRLLGFPGPRLPAGPTRVLGQGATSGPRTAPHAVGDLTLPLPAGWRDADALSVTARLDGAEVWNGVWPIARAARMQAADVARGEPPSAQPAGRRVRLSGGGVDAFFDAGTGLLSEISRAGRRLRLSKGPRLVALAPRSGSEPVWAAAPETGSVGIYRPAATVMANLLDVKLAGGREDGWAGFTLEASRDGRSWETVYSGRRGIKSGDRYAVRPGPIAAVRVRDLSQSSGPLVAIASVRIGYEPGRFALPAVPPTTVRSGTRRDPATGRAEAWLEADGAGGVGKVRWTLGDDGELTLDYAYVLEGSYLYHGVTFDHPLAEVKGVRGLIDGPRPVWQNRMRGVALGVHDIADVGRQSLPRPEHAGYFAHLRWARFDVADAGWSVATVTPGTFLRLGTRLEDHPNTTAEFPAGDISFLNAIPAMGSKFIAPEAMGPSGRPSRAGGLYAGRLTFAFDRPVSASTGRR